MDKVYTTREAAKLLDVSLRTVQLWVENGALSAWRTPGGHRRIRADSLSALLASRGEAGSVTPAREIGVLIVEDDKALSRLYEATISGWGIPVRIELARDGFDALIRLGRHKPDIIIADISMPGMDGIAMLQKIRADHGSNDVEIIVVTGLDSEQIQQRGGVPEGVAVFLKPAPFALIQAKIQEIANRKLHEGARGEN
ncbi:MAG: response regulator [Gallionella sp.]|nr:response regulator [Gallionella sp.]